MLDSENTRETFQISVEPQGQPHIDRLANELLSLIFEFTCEQNLLQEYPWRSNDKPPTQLSLPVISYLPALVISAVCRQWHSLGLVLPGLWARLKLQITEELTTSDAFMATLQLFLDRSAKAPLVLDVYTGWTTDDLFDDNPPALNLLLQHTSRWKKLRCRIDRHIFETPLSLPVLEDLNFGCVGSDDASDIFYSPPAAPKLRALEIYFPASHVVIRVPRQQITFLKFSQKHWNMESIQDFLNLTTLELDVYRLDSQPYTSLEQLESFTMTLASWYTSGELLDDFFSRFTFPSLTVLNLHLERDQERKLFWSVDAFDAFISRSSCILTTLSIRGVIISDLELIAALHLLPSLVNLSFDDSQQAWESPITSLFLSRLTLPESPYDPSAQSQSILIPKLCSLVIKFKGTSFDDAAFVKMISSRWFPNPSESYASTLGINSLRSMVLLFRSREVDEDVYGPLYELDKVRMRWGREVNEETELRPLSNLHRLGMRVVITGKHYNG